MNEQRKWTIVLMTITVFVATAAFLPALVHAGNLEPPSAPPGSTMHTLDEIYQKLEQLTSPGLVPVVKTGQATSYAAGDDGELQKGMVSPDPRFTDHGDGTVADNLTGLMWTKDANMYGMRTWADALSDCASCMTGGYSDWRLPNVRELQSLIDYSQYGLALPDGHPFTNGQSCWYGSSTTSAGNPSHAWYVYLGSGHMNAGDKVSGLCVWCVRGGQ